MWSVIIGAAAALLVVWVMAVRQKLSEMEQNISNAMAQVIIHISLRLDALHQLMKLMESLPDDQIKEYETILKSLSIPIKTESFGKEVLRHRQLVDSIIESISAAAEQLHGIESNNEYLKCINMIESCSKTIHTGCLIYNDSVVSFNRSMNSFPTSLICKILGFYFYDTFKMD